jgi:hypothetical protein
MRGTGFAVVGTGLLVAAIVTGAVLGAVVSVAIGAACGALVWRFGPRPVRVDGGTGPGVAPATSP